ncbi:MAG TPA: N(5)-(carboxyethyl)ornithine synthase [Bacilli bacterium]|nr:N(5)-(carboxyethyl)ornithine synthase [Bacilli bacterium]
MKTIGFVISKKNNEHRRALLPDDVKKIRNSSMLYFEQGYGEVCGFNDQDYIVAGANIVAREQVLKCEVIVDVKLGDADYLDYLNAPKLLVGWSHAAQNIAFTNKIISAKHSVLAWESLYEDNRYVFYKNREIAGEAAVLHGFRFSKKMPYDTRVAIIGNGQVAKGAMRVLNGLGAYVDVYDKHLETLFRKEMRNYDVIVNCVLWDITRKDRLIYRDDLKTFKKGTLIIDVSCDRNLEIETTTPTTIDNPVYEVDGVIHYAVDNTPALFSNTVTKHLSVAFSKYVDFLVSGDFNKCLDNSIVIKDGVIIDETIKAFRHKMGL